MNIYKTNNSLKIEKTKCYKRKNMKINNYGRFLTPFQ